MPVDHFRRDLRVGLRALAKERTFCALAVTVLALGIGGVTTMFSVVHGVMLRGFAFPNADRLTSVSFIDPSRTTFFGVNRQISAMDYEELVTEQRSFERMAAYLNGSTINATVDGTPRRYQGAYVTEHFLRILGVAPALGRDLSAADNRPGAENVALISHGLWQRDFGGRADVVGKAVRINGKPATIVGVMPQGFNFPVNEELWLPLYSEFPVRPRNDPQAIAPAVMALIRPDVPIDQATLEITGFAKRFAQAYPESNGPYTTGLVEPLIRTYTPPPLRGTLWTMLAFCVGLLLIACVNVMNMQFARTTLRGRELAVRSSLGASRAALVRQMLTENLVLACAGAVLGVTLAYGATGLLTRTLRGLENPPPSWITFDVDATVLTFTVIAALAAAVGSGLLPAWMSSRANPVEVLREGGRAQTSRSIGLLTRAFVVLQIVVTSVLLIGALLQLRSIVNQQTIDYGYDTGGILSARMGLMDGDYPGGAARKAFYERLLRELDARPEFEAVALTNRFRMVFSGVAAIEIEGRQYADRRDRPNANFEQVTGGFFRLTGQRLLEGRTFSDDDRDVRQPVAIVNEAFALKHFGRDSALGRRFRTVDDASRVGPWRTIVGVVPTTRMLGPFDNPDVDESGFYVPFQSGVFGPASAEPAASQFATVAVTPRGGVRAEALAPALRRAVQAVDPNLPLYFVSTPRDSFEVFFAQNRVIASMFTIFGAVAVILAAVGIYGVTAFAVSRRTQEFGVRMALGADRRRILQMVMRQGGVQVVLGLAAGLGVAVPLGLLGGDAIRNVLFGVDPVDPVTYAAVVAMVVVVSMAATFVPARRATRLDPLTALRTE